MKSDLLTIIKNVSKVNFVFANSVDHVVLKKQSCIYQVSFFLTTLHNEAQTTRVNCLSLRVIKLIQNKVKLNDLIEHQLRTNNALKQFVILLCFYDALVLALRLSAFILKANTGCY